MKINWFIFLMNGKIKCQVHGVRYISALKRADALKSYSPFSKAFRLSRSCNFSKHCVSPMNKFVLVHRRQMLESVWDAWKLSMITLFKFLCSINSCTHCVKSNQPRKLKIALYVNPVLKVKCQITLLMWIMLQCRHVIWLLLCLVSCNRMLLQIWCKHIF